MSRGKVTKFSTTTGYGFIEDSDTGESLFVHQRDINMEGYRSLCLGEEVTFRTEQNEKGLKAVDVTLVHQREERRDIRPRNDSPRPRRDNNDRRDDNDRRPPRKNGPSWDEHNRLQRELSALKGVVNRLIDAMAYEDEVNGGSLLSKEEIRQIREGVRVVPGRVSTTSKEDASL